MTYLPGHDGKVTSDKQKISISLQGYKGGNRDYCRHFSVTIETTGKFVIVFVRFILGKVWVDGFTGPSRESYIRYECDLTVVLKGFGFK